MSISMHSALVPMAKALLGKRVGDVVTVTGYAAKTNKNMASTRSVTMADGRALFGGTQGIQ